VTSFAGACGLTLCDAESPVHLSFDREYGTGAQRAVLEVFRWAVDTPLGYDQHER
jgi:hypothetical protein